jgi:branched-chain amino acid aminotransferase
MTTSPKNAPFGSILTDTMAIAWYREGAWSPMELRRTGTLEIHPAAHALHYGSSCFEGFKAYRHPDGSVQVFRLARHIERMRRSAQALILPEPDPALLANMVNALVDRVRADVPEAPGALYLRPLLFGTMPNIGAASTPSNEACLVVLASPVWDYFAGGIRPLKILVEEQAQRCAPHLGMVKTGGNYAAAMGPTLAARKAHGVDQVLFCPGGEVQETGASNFLLIRPGHILTRSLDSSFLHGVTRDSLLTIARDMGYRIEERVFSVDEMMDWIKTGEAALSGTAAVLSSVGTLVRHGVEHRVGDGQVGPETLKLRAALVAVQQGQAPDPHGWLTRV